MASSKLIVITGVTSGLGRALTAEFIKAGHVVFGCGRTESKVGQLKKSVPPPHDFHTVDVASDEAVRSWAGICLDGQGVPDLLINNAGVINPNAPLWTVSARDFNRVMEVNVMGVANVIRHFLPAMVKRKRGVIVNISSGWGRSTDAEVAPYCASKWAIEGLTQALSQELPSGMAAVPVNPGIIDTEMLRGSFGSAAGNYPKPDIWAKKAAPFLLGLGPADNGKQREVSL